MAVNFIIKNETRWDLLDPISHCDRGHSQIPPTTIRSGMEGRFLVRSKMMNLWGSTGTAAWSVGSQPWRVVIGWEAPRNFALSGRNNRLAVGIISADAQLPEFGDITDRATGAMFKSLEYINNTSMVSYTNPDRTVCVAGVMSTGHKAEVRVFIKHPERYNNNLNI